MTSPLSALHPEGWPEPRGYSNGMMGLGRVVLVGGQIGWDREGRFAQGLVAQTRQALRDLLAVVQAAGGGPEHIGRLTWYVVDMEEYRASVRELGPAYREVMGRHFPAMSLVQVVSLVEREARVEIEATAIIPD